MIGGFMEEKLEKLMKRLDKSLSKDKTMKKILIAISDILTCLKIGAPTISHHLKELSNANLITTTKNGKFLMANINKETLEQIKDFIDLK
jgi:DNA-binding transcriptional ArsR family regulator